MNRMLKVLISLVAMMGIVFGLVGLPQVSRAFSFTYPATTVYVEMLNKQGKEFTKQLDMEAKSVTFMRNSSPPFDYKNVGDSPITITRVGGKTNVFAIQIPAYNGTASGSYVHSERLGDVKITTPLSTITSIGSVTPTKSFRRATYYEQSATWSSGTIGATIVSASRNGDNTWNIGLGDSLNVSGYDTSEYGLRGTAISSGFGNFNAWGLDGDYFPIRLVGPQVQEIFEDEAKALIPPPSGYTNNNYTDVFEQPQSYQMDNDSNLPKTYIDSGFIYTYKGWYKGAGNQSSIVTTHPPSINFNATLNDSQNEVHIVYNKRALRIVDEEYIDTSSSTIDSSWNNMGQQFAVGDTFTQTPAATKTDSSGVIWEYQGWKLGSEPMSAMRPSSTPVSVLIDANKTIQYVYKKKQHTMTEKWVDQADGSTLVPLSVNPKTSTIDDNDHFTGSATAVITDTHGGIWDFVGWENVTDAAGTVNSAPAYAVNNIKGSKEIRYHYQARNTTATLDLNPTPQVVMSGGNVAWSSRLTNTGTSTLNNLKLKATSNWASGLSDPVQVTVKPAGGSAQNFTLSPGDWTSGFNLTGINIPNAGPNNYADITFSTIATGAVNQVLPAEIEVDGNMANPLKAENFVRIDDPDEPNLKPTGNAGLINIPDFRFGEVEVKPYAHTKGLDAASYQSGYNPYVRFMDNESTGTYSLAVKMSPFTSGAKTLPTTTAISLDNGVLKEVQNYNKHNESLSAGTYTGPLRIQSDNTTSYIAFGNTQGVFQLEYAFNDVE